MSLKERVGLYREIETKRGRPVVLYVTSSRPNASGQMAPDVIPELLDQLDAIPAESAAVDLLIASSGGDPTVAWRIMCLLRERFTNVGVLVPSAAFSAATLLALGADEIVMHPHGNLGPVDPQINVRRQARDGSPANEMRFGFEELSAFLEFARTQVGLTDQEHLRTMFEKFCGEVGTVPIGVASRSARLGLSLGEKMLRMHMKDPADTQKPKLITEALSKGFFHHGYPLGRTEAKEIGLKVADRDPVLEALMWKVWLDVERDLKMRKQFDATAEFASAPTSAPLFSPANQFNLTGLSPQQMQPLLAQMFGGNGISVDLPPVPFELIAAVVESWRHASRMVTRGNLLGFRTPDLQVVTNMITTEMSWEQRSTPNEGTT